ncbi:MAG: hypothetical protein QE263_07740 [Vampirovibrionales bacterium]|nr:hypothetical protein [Vampirovibrionales bacterium]
MNIAQRPHFGMIFTNSNPQHMADELVQCNDHPCIVSLPLPETNHFSAVSDCFGPPNYTTLKNNILKHWETPEKQLEAGYIELPKGFDKQAVLDALTTLKELFTKK